MISNKLPNLFQKKRRLGSKIDHNFNESKDFEEDPVIITQSEIQ